MKAHRRGLVPFLAVLAALTWAIGFAVWSYVGDAYMECVSSAAGETCSSGPLVSGFGAELLAVLAPAAVCLATWTLLHRYCSRGTRLARVTAAALAGLSGLACLAAALSVGVLLMPVALLLLVAVAATEPPTATAASS